MGIGDWGLGIGPNPQSPITNPQSPIPKKKKKKKNNNENEKNNNENNNNNNNQENKEPEKILGASFAEDISLMKLLKLLGYQILKTNTDLTEIEADYLKKTFYILGKNKFSEEKLKKSTSENLNLIENKYYHLI